MGEPLKGGVANAGAVVRVGRFVVRPTNPFSPTVHRLLSALRASGFDGAPEPAGMDAERERLVFIEGDVPIPPYAAWAQSDGALASLAALIRRFHDTTRIVDLGGAAWNGAAWNPELADPAGGHVICHNDVCLENVVFRRARAVALLDFDYAAPGRPEWDLARFAGLCVPVYDDASAAQLGWAPAHRPARLELIADAYGLDPSGRVRLLSALDRQIARSGQWVLGKVQAGDPNFTAMWDALGRTERHDRRRRWWADHRDTFAAALLRNA